MLLKYFIEMAQDYDEALAFTKELQENFLAIFELVLIIMQIRASIKLNTP